MSEPRHRRRMATVATVATALSAVLVVVAFSASEARQRGDVDGITLLSEPTLVADLIEARIEREVATCMAGEGFDYEPELAEAPAADVERGYGIATGSPDTGIEDPNLATLAELTDEELVDYEIALYGAPFDELDGEAPPGGCAQEAAPILDEVRAALTDIDDLLAGVTAAVGEDPRLAAAEQKWAACMEENGLRYRRIDEPAADFAARLEAAGEDGTAELAEEEVRVAEIDEACRADTVDPALDAIVADRLPELDAAAARLAEVVAG